MATIRLTGYISETGELKVDLPRGLPAGTVEVTIDLPAEAEEDLPWELRPWTEAEIAELMKFEPKTGAEIVAWLEQEGGWEDLGITDSVEWLEEQRRKRREKNQL